MSEAEQKGRTKMGEEKAGGAARGKAHSGRTFERHSVTFYSPGTFFAEDTTKGIDKWDTELACAMAKTVVERYDARPFAFRFSTHLAAEPVDDGRGGTLKVEGRLLRQSGMHYLGGKVLTLADVKADPRFGPGSVLASNMGCNHWPEVVENGSPWRSVQPFQPGDVIVDPATGRVIRTAQEASTASAPKEPPEPTPDPEAQRG